jgi:hypothetical protein
MPQFSIITAFRNRNLQREKMPQAIKVHGAILFSDKIDCPNGRRTYIKNDFTL